MNDAKGQTMIIDAHQHAFWHGRDAAGLVADMDEHGIDEAWLLSWEIPPHEDATNYHQSLNPLHVRPDGTHPGILLADLLKAREQFPDRFPVIGYCPDPRLPKAPELFEAAVRMHGVRCCGEWKFRMPIDDPRCINLFRRAGELGCPVTIHLDIPFMPTAQGEQRYAPMWYGGTIDHLARAMDACPQTTFLGHAPGFWRELASDADTAVGMYPEGEFPGPGRLYGLFENHPNLQADLSAGSALRALQRSPEHAVAFLTQFADRLLFARDNYGGDMPDFLASLDLPDDARENILFRNARGLMDRQAQILAARP